MKTNTLSITNTSLFYFVGILSIIFTSCGSYQNSSYYDSDGIYGSRSNRAVLNDSQERQYNNDKYKDYFGSLQNDNQTEEIFTNVDNYNSYNVDVQDQRNDNAGYPGWGSNPQGISINIYDNNWGMNNWGYNGGYGWNMNNWGYNNGFGWGMNNWGWNGGFGWNNWYGNNWGPTVGFGWNSWYGNNWYGNNWGYNNYRSDRSYARNEGRRGSSSFTDSNGNARNSGTFNRAENTTISRRAVNSNSSRDANFNRNSFDRSARTTPIFSRTQSQTRYDSQNAPRRGNTNNGRIERNTQSRPQSNTNNSRNYTPSRNDNSSRNYTPSSSGRSSSGNNSGGGGRSSSGGSSRGGRG